MVNGQTQSLVATELDMPKYVIYGTENGELARLAWFYLSLISSVLTVCE